MHRTGLASTCRRALGSMAQARRHEKAHTQLHEASCPLSTLPIDLYRYDATASRSATAALCTVIAGPCSSRTRSARPSGVERRVAGAPAAAASLASGSTPDDSAAPSTSQGGVSQSTFTLEDTRVRAMAPWRSPLPPIPDQYPTHLSQDPMLSSAISSPPCLPPPPLLF